MKFDALALIAVCVCLSETEAKSTNGVKKGWKKNGKFQNPGKKNGHSKNWKSHIHASKPKIGQFTVDNTNRCGASWTDANQCGKQTCENGTDAECTAPNETCFGGMAVSGCDTTLPTGENNKRCGTNWGEANGSCSATPCPGGTNEECGNGETCYADLAVCDTTPPVTGGDNTKRCGSTWGEANGSCSATPCPNGTDEECGNGESCYADLAVCDTTPPITGGSNTKRCGTSWGEANGSCSATPCPNGADEECGNGESCYADLAECDTTTPPGQLAPIYDRCVNPNHFALTFDDGPTAPTQALLDILAEKQVPATFFVCGVNLAEGQTGSINSLIRMKNDGHQIASHTYNHPDLATVSISQVTSEMVDTHNRIKAVLNSPELVTYMRPPYGSYNNAVREKLGELNYKIIMWSWDSLDWQKSNSQEIIDAYTSWIGTPDYNNVGHNTLQHDIHQKTVGAMAAVIDAVLASGKTFVRVDECLGLARDNI
eukprot:Pgem_evm1s177